jgi:DNA-binding CsgD family transcriptional regulator
MVLQNIASNYFKTNLLDYDTTTEVLFYYIAVGTLRIVALVGLSYSFFRVVIGLLEKSISTRISRLIFIGMIVIILNYSMGRTIAIQNPSSRWISILEMGLILFAVLVIYTSSVVLLLNKRVACNANNRKSIHAFSYFYLAGYTFSLAALILPYPVKLYAASMFLTLMNFIPSVWFNRFFLKYHTLVITFIHDEASLERIYCEYNISKREREIVKLILQGKSNKEIEDALFISVHTVKNHIHNLYQKLGVKSRGQLVYFMQEAQKRL